jgi:hypothetical protein
MNFQPVGFVVDDLGASQVSYLLIKNANQLLSSRHDININVFFEDNFIPCVEPKFARFNTKDAFVFDGSLIATSLKTALTIKNFTRAKRFFYINQLENLRKSTSQDEWNNILCDKNIVKFARCVDYKDELISKGYDIHPEVVEDFDLNKILEVINDR